MGRMIVCTLTTGLGELSVRDQKSGVAVLQYLRKHPRFSVFDATATKHIAKTMDELKRNGWITLRKEGFPYAKAKFTPKALELIA